MVVKLALVLKCHNCSLLILSCPTIPQEAKEQGFTEFFHNIVGLNLIFIFLHLILC
jgi:hypothetical protein